VSPILVRPVREQLEHDRVIRLLQARLKRRHEVATNVGGDQTVPVKIGAVQIYPDLVLTTGDRSRKVVGTVEVETAESVNPLEAMAQWAHLGRAKAPFHLYVPAHCVEVARRLVAEKQVNVAELWSYHTIGDQTRFTLVHKATPEEIKEAQKKAAPAGPEKAEKSEKPAAAKAAKARKTAARKTAAAAKKTARPSTRTAKAGAKKTAKAQKRKK
jgi:pyruvate/2-oxoglutarate dehydrogenase complex dihydrolipoamide acyltransferase (E2) component